LVPLDLDISRANLENHKIAMIHVHKRNS
jgi:hypothetical protein